jgi:ABC-type proline/glycine betaine transport system substrate-binding protein
MITPALLIALIQNVGIPELMAWLAARHAAGQTIDDAAIIQKLQLDGAEVQAIADKWLADHPTD